MRQNSQWTAIETDGLGTLEWMLTIAILDYEREFGRAPALITIPYWRISEIGDRMKESLSTSGQPEFRGIWFRFHLDTQIITLQ